MSDNNDLLKDFIENEQSGKEPIRLLNELRNINAWSMIPDYMVMIITQMNTLSQNLETDIILSQILDPYLQFCLSRKGYAREQFTKAHSGLNDKGLTPVLAGMLPDQQGELKR